MCQNCDINCLKTNFSSRLALCASFLENRQIFNGRKKLKIRLHLQQIFFLFFFSNETAHAIGNFSSTFLLCDVCYKFLMLFSLHENMRMLIDICQKEGKRY